MYCLNVGEGREKEELKINLRMVNFSLTEISNMGRGTNFREGQVLWGNIEFEVPVGHSGDV